MKRILSAQKTRFSALQFSKVGDTSAASCTVLVYAQAKENILEICSCA